MTGTRWQSFVVNGVVERVSTTPVPLRRDTDTVSTAYRAPPSSSRRASDDASDLGLLSLGASLRCRRKTKKESQKPPAADDGAPAGKSYQAESPDEGTLVSAAATVYGVRLVDRRTDGLVLSHDRPCPLRRNDVVAALKEGRLGNVIVPGDPDNRTRKEDSCASSARAVLSLRQSSRSATASGRNGTAHAPSNHHDHANDDQSVISDVWNSNKE